MMLSAIKKLLSFDGKRLPSKPKAKEAKKPWAEVDDNGVLRHYDSNGTLVSKTNPDGQLTRF